MCKFAIFIIPFIKNIYKILCTTYFIIDQKPY